MKKNFRYASIAVFALSLISSLTSCDGTPENDMKFTYDTSDFTDTFGSGTNSEAHPYETIMVQPTENPLRDDFAMGVDGSMVAEIEALGGKYYNQAGQEQDVFQIMARNGVNFFRVRLWNKPTDKYGQKYGGGNNNLDRDIAMALRAKDAKMNVMVDYHYSDFWADPDTQWIPKEWAAKNKDEIPALVQSYTSQTLQAFKDAGVTVDAIQVGNEINNGMIFPYGKIDWNGMDASFDYIAEILKAGITGMKEVFPNCYSVIHLANGGNKEEFRVFFQHLEDRSVNYDIIGASYYPYFHGTLEQLQDNLDNVSTTFRKPVMVMEMSYGYTLDSNEFTANQYAAADEDIGGFITSEQGQATAIRDVLNVLSKVPESRGLGIFYWEPAWLPLEGASWATALGQSMKYEGDDMHKSNYSDGLATWSNQGLFSFTGKALASLKTFQYARSGFNADAEISTGPRGTSIDVTINLAAGETLPETYDCETNYDAIRPRNVVWDSEDAAQCTAVGQYVVHGIADGQYNVVCNARCIENFVVDPSFENQGETDIIKTPWIVESQSPEGEKVIKLDRKKDVRSGTTDLNWYHSNQDFSFKVKQNISGLKPGTYTLETYIMAIAPNSKVHSELYVYITYGSVTKTVDMKNIIDGWGVPDHYKLAQITEIVIDSSITTCEIGIVGSAVAEAWGHNDDWSLVKV